VEFARLIEADGTNTLWMFNWASSLERAGRFDESVSVFRRLLALDANNAMGLNYLGYMFAERGIHLDEALDMISRAVALEPENSSFLDSMGCVLFQLGRHEEAKRYLEDAIRIDDSSALMHAHLGDINVALGEYAAARFAYERALELEPRNAQVREKIERLPIR
jgi:tetratricopeptide (TPR) repeat protein